MIRLTHVLAATAAVALCTSAPAFADFSGGYDFTSIAGTTTDFTLQGANFSSPTAMGFTAGSFGPYPLFTTGVNAAELDVSFPFVVHALSFNFAIQDLLGLNGVDKLTLTPNAGTPVTVTGSLGGGLFPTGTASIIDPTGFTSIAITSDNSANTFSVGAFGVPEPASIALIGAGMAGLAAARRRRA